MNLRTGTLILVAAFTLVVAASPWNRVSAQTPPDPTSVEIPHASEFIELLNKTGLKILAKGQSHFTGFLGTQKMAAFIKTDKGIVEVVFLDDDIPVTRVTITYQKGTGSGRHHLYTVSVQGTNRKPEEINAGYPMYFTLHRDWLIITSDGSLDMTIKRALRQTYPD